MTKTYEDILEYANFGFAFIFNVEAIVKLIGLGKTYFNSSWNKFDLTIVIGTDIGLLFRLFKSKVDVATAATLVRAFRIMRIFRLIRASKNLKVLIDTLVYIIPSLLNLGFLILLLLFIYAALGINLFATVFYQD